MSDQPITLTFTRGQLIQALIDLDAGGYSYDDQGAGYGADVVLHSLAPSQFPIHPDDAATAIATGPTAFQPAYPGSPQYYRPDSPFVLLHQPQHSRVQVLGPSPYPSGNLSTRPVVHTVAVLADGLDDAIAAASAAVDHMSGR